jgi:hypothetical protein
MSLSGKLAVGAGEGSTIARMKTPIKIKINLLNITASFLCADHPAHTSCEVI